MHRLLGVTVRKDNRDFTESVRKHHVKILIDRQNVNNAILTLISVNHKRMFEKYC